jgi:hypothetical protein
MRINNDVERQRARRTLSEVKNKLEEALRLSVQLQHKGTNEQSSTPDRRS